MILNMNDLCQNLHKILVLHKALTMKSQALNTMNVDIVVPEMFGSLSSIDTVVNDESHH